jgi:Alpha galactosidase C-terminal beta sandwich domain/Alpha galactosidase A
MKRQTRLILTAVTAMSLLLAYAVASGTASRAATAYPPGGPDRTPVMGWSGWSFLRLGANSAQVKGEAKALVSTGLAAAGYQYVNLDDGWYQCPGSQGPNVDSDGRWVVNTANYPNVGSENGIAALAAYVHSLGLKFGIYETPGISGQAVSENTPILGTSYTADDIATTKKQANYNCGGMNAIDYSQPGAQAYTDSVVDQLASWGVDYIKLDGISNGDIADVQAWQAAIQQSGRPMVLNITQGSYTIKLAPTLQEYANQWEFAPDIEFNGPDEGSADACNAPPYTGCLSVFPLTSYDDWSADRFASVAKWQPYGGPGGFNDYDSIEVGDGSADSGMSLAASESQLSLWSLASAPLILGSDLTSAVTNAYGTSAALSPADLSLLTNRQVIGVDQDAIDASRIGHAGSPGSAAGHQVFAKVESRGDAIVGLFNTTTTLSSSPVTISTTAAKLGLPADPNGYQVQDLWGGQSTVVGGQATFDISSAGKISAVVPSEGVALYRVTPLS